MMTVIKEIVSSPAEIYINIYRRNTILYNVFEADQEIVWKYDIRGEFELFQCNKRSLNFRQYGCNK